MPLPKAKEEIGLLCVSVFLAKQSSISTSPATEPAIRANSFPYLAIVPLNMLEVIVVFVLLSTRPTIPP